MSSICNVEAGYSVNGPLSAEAPMFSTIVPYSATCETQSGGKCSKDEHKHPGHPKSDKNDCMKNTDTMFLVLFQISAIIEKAERMLIMLLLWTMLLWWRKSSP